MSREFPSMTALLGLLAVAGFQNRDRIAELLRGASGPSQAAAAGAGQDSPSMPAGLPGSAGGFSGAGSLGGLGGLLGNLAGGAGAGSLLGNGLQELVQRFRENGQGDAADSWVSTGANRPVEPHQLEQAIGPGVLDQLTRSTGLSRDEILSRLARELPNAVDRYTPDGQLPPAQPGP
jgi:uncharacterized protein YidB (DUF937 family)